MSPLSLALEEGRAEGAGDIIACMKTRMADGSERAARLTLAVAAPAFRALSPAAIAVSRRIRSAACSALNSPSRTSLMLWKVLTQPAITAVMTAAEPAARRLCWTVALFR